MSSEVVISVESLGKKYRIRHQADRPRYTALRDVLADRTKSAWRKTFGVFRSLSASGREGRGEVAGPSTINSQPSAPAGQTPNSYLLSPSPARTEDFWALKDVNFEVRAGEVLGIIGRNGAGKSTLLKILSRITEPTEGRVRIKGRVASLLEVGTGFHPELTGRENIFLNGAILGMTRVEIKRKFDEIVAFAEIEKFLDTPVKRYSSGMYVRLAFAVAAHLEPEIMIVDEVLAVGDAQFQKKCLGKMGDVAKGGHTVLFVSHQMATVRALTSKCMLLRKGCLSLTGTTDKVVESYLNDTEDPLSGRKTGLEGYHRNSVSNAPVYFTRIWVNNDQETKAQVEMGEDFIIHLEIQSQIDITGALVALSLKKHDGTLVTSIFSYDYNFYLSASSGKNVIACRVNGLPLVPGDYLLQAGVDQSAVALAWDVIIDYPLMTVVEGNSKLIPWPNRAWGVLHWRNVDWIV